jgi:hypothetical protein
VYRFYDLYAIEKFVEPFSNGVVVFGFHLKYVSVRLCTHAILLAHAYTFIHSYTRPRARARTHAVDVVRDVS